MVRARRSQPPALCRIDRRPVCRNNFHTRLFLVFMMNSDRSHLDAAIQHLVWAIEDILQTGNKKAECYARLALKHLEQEKTSDPPGGAPG